MKLNPYLYFPGTCADAAALYEKVLGAKSLFKMTYGESPMPDQQPGWADKIMHATLQIGDGDVIMASDAPPAHYSTPQGFTISITPESVADAERIFAELSEGGVIIMPLQQTFWAARFGMLKDKFGIPWMINREKE